MSFNAWQGQKVRLRAVEPDDWETYHRDGQDTEAARMGDGVHFPRAAEVTRQWAQELSTARPKGDNNRWAIETLDGVLVGMIGTFHCNAHNGTFEYGLGIFREHWRNGYASEAIRLVLAHYLRELRYQKVNVHVYAFNEPSMRLHEALGFQQEDRLRRMIYTDGAYHDILLYGLTREEFDAASHSRTNI